MNPPLEEAGASAVPEPPRAIGDPPVKPVFINLPSGKPLTSKEASSLIRATGSPLVLLAGEVGSGKTTLLASLHDAFQFEARGFGGYIAAGSSTLLGFEERCFDSRAASGAGEPHTIRTNFDDGHLFYHLRLRDHELKQPAKDIVFADMSGEFYERALDSADEMRELTIITRADHFVLLVDASKLQANKNRAHTRATALMLMRRCFEEKMLNKGSKVDILLTKWDLVLARLGEEDAGTFLAGYLRFFQDEYAQKVRRVTVIPVAARPYSESRLPLGYGLGALLHKWLQEPRALFEQADRQMPVPALTSSFDRFALVEAPQLYEVPNG